jgi:ABC-type lipoprotein release transport system permease subunit
MGRILLIAFRNIFAHRRRSLLLGLAIAFVTFLLVGAFAFSSAIKGAMVESATTLASGHVNVGGFYKASVSMAQPTILDYAKVEAVVRQASPHIVSLQRRARGNFDRLTSDKTSLLNAVAGVDFSEDSQLKRKLTLLEGSFEALKAPGSALVFHRQATELGLSAGDRLTISGLTTRGVQNRLDLKVGAIAKDMGGLSQIMTFVAEQSVNELYEFRPENTGVLMLFLDDEARAFEVASAVRSALRKAGYEVMEPEMKPFWQKKQFVEREDWTGQRLDVSTWRDEMGDLAKTVDALDFISVVLTFILLVIIAIGLWNTLLMAVRERTPEIGALRAIGMSRGKVRLMFVSEAWFLALLASGFGALLAGITVAIMNAAEVGVSDPMLQFILMSDRLTFTIEPGRVSSAILFISTFAALAALWPAHRAAKIQPGAAMSHAG